jgi:hypothetical protein
MNIGGRGGYENHDEMINSNGGGGTAGSGANGHDQEGHSTHYPNEEHD